MPGIDVKTDVAQPALPLLRAKLRPCLPLGTASDNRLLVHQSEEVEPFEVADVGTGKCATRIVAKVELEVFDNLAGGQWPAIMQGGGALQPVLEGPAKPIRRRRRSCRCRGQSGA